MKHLRQFETSSYCYICVFKINPYVCWEFFEKKIPDWRRLHDFFPNNERSRNHERNDSKSL